MKILILSDDFLLDSDIVGGATIATLNLSAAFKAAGHEVSAITASKHREKCGSLEVNGMRVERLYTPYSSDRFRAYRSVYNPGILKQLDEAIARIKPDIVLAHNVHMYLSYYSLVVARKYAKKVFVTAHDIMPFYPGTFTEFIKPKERAIPTYFDYRVSGLAQLKKFRFRYNPFRNFLIKKILNRVDGVIVVSESLQEALNQNGICVKRVIHNGIDVNQWNINPKSVDHFREAHKIVGKKVVLFQGRLSGAKGGNLILLAMKMVVDQNPNTVLLVAGVFDDYAKRMLGVAEQLGIGAHVVFTGWLDAEDIKKAYGASDVVVIPSVCFDSFPNGNLEAFASHKPVVTTCFGGGKEIVQHDHSGFIVNPYNVESLASSILDLVSNPEKAKKFGENGYARLRNGFTDSEMAQQYISLFSE